MTDETTTRHEPLVVETVVLAPAEQRGRSERTVCRACWIETPNDDGESSNLGRVAWPCEVARLRERVAALEAERREYRSLLESAEHELDWLTLHHVIEDEGKDWRSKFDGSAFFACDCSEAGGYMEYDTNAYIHAGSCASWHEDSLGALHDLIKAALAQADETGGAR